MLLLQTSNVSLREFDLSISLLILLQHVNNGVIAQKQ